MPALVKDILKGVDDNGTLEDEMVGVCALGVLLDDYKNYRTKYDATLPAINEESTGLEFKKAILNIPPKNRLVLLSRYAANLEDGSVCHISNNTNYVNNDPTIYEDDVDNDEFHKSKEYLTKLIIYSFLVLAVIIIVTITYTTSIGAGAPGSDAMGTIMSSMVEILKVLLGI